MNKAEKEVMMSDKRVVRRQKVAKTDEEMRQIRCERWRRGFGEGLDVVLERKGREYVNSEKQGAERSGEKGGICWRRWCNILSGDA